jgi:hypothetical protein
MYFIKNFKFPGIKAGNTENAMTESQIRSPFTQNSFYSHLESSRGNAEGLKPFNWTGMK